MEGITQALATEKWSKVEVPHEYQTLIDSQYAVLGGGSGGGGWEGIDEDASPDGVMAGVSATVAQVQGSSLAGVNSPVSPKVKWFLTLQQRSEDDTSNGGMTATFPVVPSLLTLLRVIASYLHCAVELPSVGPDILNRLVEILKLFNSRTCQLLLGAGARQVAGLKSITATHLALG